MPRRVFVLYPWRKTTTKKGHCDLPRGENEKPHAGRKKVDLLQICSRQKLIGKDGTFLMPHLYTSFTRGCRLGVKCGINHFCSHLLLSWYYFVIYLSKIGAIPVFRPVTHTWPAASKLPDNAKCRCLPNLLGMYYAPRI